MKLSVVIPNYNDLRIRRAVASVQRQTHPDRELLIIDGGSSNPELLAYYDSCGADRVVREKDGGIFDALNKGLRLATGDVVYLMGSDDELSDEHVFADVARRLADEPRTDGICIGCEFVNSAGEIVRSWYPREVSADLIKRGLLPPHFSLFLRRELYDLVGEFRFSEVGNVACDSVWLLDLAIRKPDLRIPVMNEHHLRMEYGGASTRSLGAIWRQFRVVHRNARRNAAHLPFWYFYSALKTLSKVRQLRLFRG
jgi:glycosyltransferase